MSLAGICLYSKPGCGFEFGWQVTFNTQLAPTLVGSTASRPFPSNKNGNTVDAGCVSISEIRKKTNDLNTKSILGLKFMEQSNKIRHFEK